MSEPDGLAAHLAVLDDAIELLLAQEEHRLQLDLTLATAQTTEARVRIAQVRMQVEQLRRELRRLRQPSADT